VLIYRSATGDNTYDNPFSGTVDGVVEFFLERPQRVNIQATADGLGTVVLDYEPALGDPSDTAFRGPSPWADVTAYGAVGDGIADDTAALNTAYTEAKAAHAPLFFPNLEYRITAPLDWLASGMQIFGLGGGIDPVNGVYGARLVTSAALSFMLRLSGEHFGLSGLMLNGGGAAVHGLELGDAYYFDVERVLATGNQTGIYSSGNQYSGRFMGARGFKNSLIGLHIKKPSSGGSATQKMDLFGVACEGNAQHGLIIEGGEEVNVWGGAYQGYGVGYPTQRGIRLVGNAANCVIVGPHIESNTIAGISMEKWLSTDGPYSAETCKVIGATIFAGTGGNGDRAGALGQTRRRLQKVPGHDREYDHQRVLQPDQDQREHSRVRRPVYPATGRAPERHAGVANFPADDRVRMVRTTTTSRGRCSWTETTRLAPANTEMIELHYFDPEFELRPSVLDGLKRCYFWDTVSIASVAPYGKINVSSLAPWITSPRQIMSAEAQAGSVNRFPSTRIPWSRSYQVGSAVYLDTSNTLPGTTVLTVLRPVGSLVNGDMSLSGPDDDWDVLPVELEYAVRAAHVAAWTRHPERLTPVAAQGMGIPL
jgi:hypothetical protein